MVDVRCPTCGQRAENLDLREIYESWTTENLNVLRSAFEVDLADWHRRVPDQRQVDALAFIRSRVDLIALVVNVRKEKASA